VARGTYLLDGKAGDSLAYCPKTDKRADRSDALWTLRDAGDLLDHLGGIAVCSLLRKFGGEA